MSRLWRWRRSREQRGSAELLVSHQDKRTKCLLTFLQYWRCLWHLRPTLDYNDVVFQDLATVWSAPCWTGSWGRWRTTWPASRRCSATSSTPSPPLSARQTTPPPSLLHTWTKSLPSGHRFSLAPHSFTGTTPVTPLLQNPYAPAVQSNCTLLV